MMNHILFSHCHSQEQRGLRKVTFLFLGKEELELLLETSNVYHKHSRDDREICFTI